MAERRVALLIGCGTYDDSRLKGLKGPAIDVSELSRVLGNPSLGNFQISSLVDGSNHQVLLTIEDFLAVSQPEDLLLIHLSCHGLKDSDGKLYFAASNTRPDRLLATALSSHTLNEMLSANRARRKVLFLDCCYGGSFLRGVLHRGAEKVGVLDRFSQGRGLAVITSSDALQYAFEGEPDGVGPATSSVFTQTVVRGIETGAADLDGDGLIGLTELFEYVTNHLASVRADQKPEMNTFRIQGEIVISRSLNVPLMIDCDPDEARSGFQRTVTIEDQELSIVVPPRASDGQQIRIPGAIRNLNSTEPNRDLVATIKHRHRTETYKVPLGYTLLRSGACYIVAGLAAMLFFLANGYFNSHLGIELLTVPCLCYGLAALANGEGARGWMAMSLGTAALMPLFVYSLLTPRSKLDAVVSLLACFIGFVTCGITIRGIARTLDARIHVTVFASAGLISALLSVSLGMARLSEIGCSDERSCRSSRLVELQMDLGKDNETIFHPTWLIPLTVPLMLSGVSMAWLKRERHQG